ncbi:MAG: HAD family hydrolase [Candidatus Micrarchaeota archaeon]|nr:HAD family hydrolase [Candidatus Micrarchaeota archaeon]
MALKYELFLFDLDGTLIDNRIAIRDSVNFALGKFGLEMASGPKIDSQIGKHLPDIFRALTPEGKWNLAEELSKAYRERYVLESDKGLTIFDGVEQALDMLKERDIEIGIVTNKVEGVALLLKKIGLYERFKIIISPSNELRPKPYPDMLLRALEVAKVNANRAAYVGDTAIDVNSAKNAKITSIAVMTGAEIGMVNLRELMEAKPDFIIPNLLGLGAILSK